MRDDQQRQKETQTNSLMFAQACPNNWGEAPLVRDGACLIARVVTLNYLL